MYVRIRYLVTILAFIAFAPFSNAALISVDSPIYGPDSITRDTVTGLDWLDPSLTLGLTFREVFPQLAPGGRFAGFRYATLTGDLFGLYTSAGIPDLSPPTPFAGTAANFVPARDLVNLIGPTTASGTAVRGITGSFIGPVDPVSGSTTWADVNFNDRSSTGMTSLGHAGNFGGGGVGAAPTEAGSWLIAGIATNPGNPVIPIPISPGEFGFACRPALGLPCLNEIRYYDPIIAIGYDFVVDPGTEFFASVLLPVGFTDNFYDLFLFNGTDFVDSGIDIEGGVEYSFIADLGVADGLSQFGIRGIEIGAAVDPNDPLAFVTGLSFVDDTEGGFTMSAVTFDTDTPPPSVPEPTTLLLLGLGLAGLGFSRRRLH